MFLENKLLGVPNHRRIIAEILLTIQTQKFQKYSEELSRCVLEFPEEYCSILMAEQSLQSMPI